MTTTGKARSMRGRLMLATALCVAPLAASAWAQESSVLEEVVVTATKQESTVSKVPLSIAVVSRDAIDNQGIRNAEDISRITPSLRISNGNSPNGSGVTIRGLSSAVGAPTVGIYLDDIQITRRNANGAVAGNGTNFPQLFDVERVEVLRGPQGTLYGGSSIGGTIKLVLPQPSLTTKSLRTKAEVAYTEDGAPSYELGVSGSAPLVADKIGIAGSLYGRRLGGYIDHVSRFDGRVLEENTNEQVSYSGRLAVLFQANEHLKIQPAIYASRDEYKDQDTYWTNVGAYSLAATTTATNTIAGVPYTHPAFSYPAYNVFGPYRTGQNCNVGENFRNTVEECVAKSPRESTLILPSLTVDFDIGGFAFKSLTSYTSDTVEGSTNNSFEDLTLFVPSAKPFIADLPIYRNDFSFKNKRTGWTQEFRVATPADRRFSAVGGVFFSDFTTDSLSYFNAPTLGNVIRTLFGQTIEQRFAGVNTLPYAFIRTQTLDEKETAIFGEVTFKATDQLRFIGGLRVAETEFSYVEAQYGTTVNRRVATPGAGLTQGTVKETSNSPKVAVQYFLNDRDMFYASATKGFRPGGVASRPAGTICDAELAQLGFGSATAVPFESDSVWSYEAGAKARPFTDRLSIDASIYYVDWKDTQVNYRLNCQGSYVANAGQATSKGVDFSAQFAPTDWLTLSATVSYVDAKFDRLALTTNGVTTVFINQGDQQPVPKWSYSLGAVITRPITDDIDGYFRADYQHTGEYPRSFSAGTNGFFPDVYMAEETDFVSIRGGVKRDRWDLSAFVNNLFESKDVLTVNANAGRGTCGFVNGAITTCARDTPYAKETTFRPRTFGLTARMKY